MSTKTTRVVPFLLATVWLLPACVSTESHSRSLPKGDGTKPDVTSPPATPDKKDPYRYGTANETFVRLDAALRGYQEVYQEPIKMPAVEEVLRGMSEANLVLILTELKEGSDRNRTIAAAALGFSRSDVAPQALVQALADPLPAVVANALSSLARVGTPGCVPTDQIFAFLRNEEASIRSNAALVLGSVVTPGPESGALEPLVLALQDSDPVTRSNAAMSLGKIGDREAIGHLVQSLSDDMPRVRALSAQSLGLLKDGSAVQALIGRLRDPNSLVRDRVRHALVAITGKDLGPDPESWAAEYRG